MRSRRRFLPGAPGGLRDAIPGANRVVEVPGTKLFFAEDRALALTVSLRSFLERHPGKA